MMLQSSLSCPVWLTWPTLQLFNVWVEPLVEIEVNRYLSEVVLKVSPPLQHLGMALPTAKSLPGCMIDYCTEQSR